MQWAVDSITICKGWGVAVFRIVRGAATSFLQFDIFLPDSAVEFDSCDYECFGAVDSRRKRGTLSEGAAVASTRSYAASAGREYV